MRQLKKPILIGLCLNILVFCLLMLAYWAYARTGSGPLAGSFPRPTAIMLYGLWPIQAVFVVIYVWAFDRWIFTAEDQEKFQQIVKARQQRMEGETGGS